MANNLPIPKTALLWNADKHRELQLDLMAHRRRGRGKRVKELAELGLLAERRGFRLERDGDTFRLAMDDGFLIQVPAEGSAVTEDASQTVADDPISAHLMSQFVDQEDQSFGGD